MSAPPRRRPGLAARIGRTIGIVLVFVAVGPPIGGLAFTLIVAATYGGWGKFDPAYELQESSQGLLFFSLAVGYWFGAGPTAVAGLVIGIKQAFLGPTTWWMALAMGFVAGVVLVKSFGGDFELDFEPAVMPQHAVLILTAVVAVMLCWSMVRNWYFASIATEAVP